MLIRLKFLATLVAICPDRDHGQLSEQENGGSCDKT